MYTRDSLEAALVCLEAMFNGLENESPTLGSQWL